MMGLAPRVTAQSDLCDYMLLRHFRPPEQRLRDLTERS
jgi:hypothetical protein